MFYTLVTGATGVLGKCFCTQLALQKQNLILTGRDILKLTQLKLELMEICADIDVQIFACQMANEQDRARFFKDISQFKLNKLILVAGNDNQMGLAEYTQQKAIEQIRANYESVVDLVRFCLPKMQSGQVLAVSSLTAIVPMPYFAIYSSTKRAVLDFFRAISFEFPAIKFSVALPSSMPTRPDIIQDIKRQGLTGKLASQPPQKVAKICLKKLGRKKIILVGFYNKIVYFLNKITPLKIKGKLISKKFKNKRKENF